MSSRVLHPSPPPDPLPPRPVEAPSVSFSSASVRAFLRERAPRGSAPGLSGWTESLLLPLAEDSHLLLALTSLLEDIACDRLDPASPTRLLSCRLIPARKKDNGVRPIAPFACSHPALSHAFLLPYSLASGLLPGLKPSSTGSSLCSSSTQIMFS